MPSLHRVVVRGGCSQSLEVKAEMPQEETSGEKVVVKRRTANMMGFMVKLVG